VAFAAKVDGAYARSGLTARRRRQRDASALVVEASPTTEFATAYHKAHFEHVPSERYPGKPMFGANDWRRHMFRPRWPVPRPGRPLSRALRGPAGVTGAQ
jgi:hypothetical protein